MPGFHSSSQNGQSNTASVSANPASGTVSIGAAQFKSQMASNRSVSLSIVLCEPHVYLSGLVHNGLVHVDQDFDNRDSTAMIRGKLRLDITKSVKIKAVNLSFCGKARVEWPEDGIPLSKMGHHLEEKLKSKYFTFSHASRPDPNNEYGTNCSYTLHRTSPTSDLNGSISDIHRPSHAQQSTSPSRSLTASLAKGPKALSLQHLQASSFNQSDSALASTPQQKGYRVFYPGIYEYGFEILLDHTYPETIRLPNGNVRWMLEGVIERAGAFKSNIHVRREVSIVRAPDQPSLGQIQAIAIRKTWEDCLYYDVVISGQTFPLGSRISIAFKLTPLDKVQCYSIQVYVTEHVNYFTDEKKTTRIGADSKVLLFERHAGRPIAKSFDKSEFRLLSGGEITREKKTEVRARLERLREQCPRRRDQPQPNVPETPDNLLGGLDLGADELITSTEIEMDVQLPTCPEMKKDSAKIIHPDANWKLIQLNHWLKTVIRLSKLDGQFVRDKRRSIFEISIDSPIQLLSCLATQRHTSLPEYTYRNGRELSRNYECGCPNAPVIDSIPLSPSLEDSPPPENRSWPQLSDAALPEFTAANDRNAAHRLVHTLRNQSENPPMFNADDRPPPLMTPPPGYDVVVGTPSHNGMADYFERLGDAYSTERVGQEIQSW